jgi:Cu/Ag efflux pump CusA
VTARPDCCSALLFSFSQPISTRVDELLSGVKAQLAIKRFGPNLDILAAKGREIETLTRSVEGIRDVALEQVAGEAQLVIRPDRDVLTRYGLARGPDHGPRIRCDWRTGGGAGHPRQPVSAMIRQ